MMAVDPDQRLQAWPPRCVSLPAGGCVAVREAGGSGAATHVLLHGIGSASGSWIHQLERVANRPALRVLAWDAPGYGDSTPLEAEAPDASAYAERLWALLDALGQRQAVTLVGHSLGALMAARAARLQPGRVRRLILLSPARGHARAGATERQRRLEDRLGQLERLGPAGLAAQRAAALLSPTATDAQLALVRHHMAHLHPAGYAQAARLLAGGDLESDVAGLGLPVSVACGDADTITPPSACARVASAAGVALQSLGPVGHACPIEAPDAVDRLLGLDD